MAKDAVSQAIDSKKPYTIEYRIVHANGNLRWVFEKGQGVLDNTGQLLCLDGVIVDITNRKQAEEALRESEVKYRQVVENATEGIFVIQDNAYCYVNQRGAEIFNTSREKILSGDLYEFVHPDDRKACADRVFHRKQGETTGELLVHRIIDDSGNEKWVEVRGVSILWEGRHASICFVIDITARKKMETRLRQAQKMEAIGTLAGGIAHDFNNILSPLVGFSEMLKADLAADSPLQKYVDEIFRAALRARDLVKQILAFSRQDDQDTKPIKLQPIVKEVLQLLRNSIPTTIDIQHDIDPGCGVVIADPTKIHQIIMNLATNAFHAMEETGGRIEVYLKQIRLESNQLLFPELTPGEYAGLTVVDTGAGIEKDVLDKIFDPYYTTKKNGKGTGLGLSVVQGIVKSCNGDIRVYSEPGKGTEIQVYLPIMDRKIDNKVMDRSEPVLGGTEKILLVDDEEAIVRMEQQMLERLGYRVTVRTGSVEALEAFKANADSFDLVVTDMTMPNMTGLQLTGEIKSIRSDIPIIICTGFSDQINEENCEVLGIQGFAMKPVIMNEIAQVIRKVLDNSRKG
jgi:PAS domain S-box-containing protein